MCGCCHHPESATDVKEISPSSSASSVKNSSHQANDVSISELLQWLFPLATLALMPKCPACVAAYALLLTGIGLSFSAATALRWSLIMISLIAMAVLIHRSGRRLWTAKL